MGVFWKYFQKTLRFLPILQPGPLAALAEGGAATLDSARTAALWLRDQAFPERCELERLADYAAARGINRFEFELDEQFYGRVRAAYAWHILGGRPEGVRLALVAAMGTANVTLEALRDSDPERWAEHRIRITGISGAALNNLPTVEATFNEVKQGGAKLAGIDVEITLPTVTRYHGVGGMSTGEVATIYPFGVAEIALPILGSNRRMAILSGEVSIIYPLEV